jgi:hypothetical protein
MNRPSDHEPAANPASPSPLRPDLLARQRIHRTLWMSVVEGGFTQVFLVWTSGSVLTGWMLHLGASPAQLAAVVSIPLLMQVLNPLLAWVIANLGSRKQFMIVSGLLGRSLWLTPVLLPLFGWPAERLPLVMLGVVFVSSLVQSGLGPAWA